MRKLIAIVLVLFFSTTLPMAATPAQAAGGPSISFARTYGQSPSVFSASSVEQTTDDGFIVAGQAITQTSTGTFVNSVWLLRLDTFGGIVWQKAYGTCTFECPQVPSPGTSVRQTPDGGFVVASTTNVSSTTLAAWVFKVDSTGSLVWQEAFTGVGNAAASSIDLTPDGGIVVAGSTAASQFATPTVLVLKLDGAGTLVWAKTYSGLGVANSIRQTSDGGLVVAGIAGVLPSTSGWLMKLDPGGNIIWQRAYGNGAGLISAQQTLDGGFIAAGFGIFPETPPLGVLVIRLDSVGTPIWEKSYREAGAASQAFSVQQTSDGGFIVAGATGIGRLSASALVFRLDGAGNIIWQRTFAAPSLAFSVRQTSDGGFVAAGTASSTIGFEAMAFKTNSRGEIHPCRDLSKSSLVASALSTSATSIMGKAVDITSPPIATMFTSMDTTAMTTALCHHGFKP